ncbi:hypothetical protein N0V93_004322 [Gnomoniopsis smithogilvyi]|uniref:Tryptophan halogenase n=1 Tax=Gnomoniopsis smithogilvyi TaxID=1191159 RepID=A0A9W9CX06_9PEZI|nr:hypothetical protein N0V93_004322 [Gnomoniopsis smithogilvyi]
MKKGLASPTSPTPSITVFEKSDSPQYKIGESTLTTFGLWLKTIGIGPALLWRLFGPKDGLAFFYLNHEDPDNVGTFAANGPPGDFVPTLQIERTISELLLTLYAQRMGVQVHHGHSVNIDVTDLGKADIVSEDPVRVQVVTNGESVHIKTRLLVDATGRFRRFASKASRKRVLPGFNTDSFWAYFEFPGNDADIPLPYYESCNTNHICLPEGWAWIIRLPSWQGSSLPNLTRMINYLLDLNSQDTHPDDYPSALQLALMFDLKFRWVVSIGYALRNDVVYPDSLSDFGSCEAERKFNWITSRYQRMQALMDQHILIKDLYGPKTTWFIRKALSYESTIVGGPRWAAIGDASGFTNPLYSPGINCNMATSVFLAESTNEYLTSKTTQGRTAVIEKYSKFCESRVQNLHRMNMFNYLMMRSPQTGPLGPLWQYLCGTGNEQWRNMRACTFDNVAESVTTWDWGAQRSEYIAFANEAIELLAGPPSEASAELVAAIMKLSDQRLAQVMSSGKYSGRWAGLLRWYDDELRFCPEKTKRDVLARKCEACGNWRILRDDITRCATCGAVNKYNEIVRYN